MKRVVLLMMAIPVFALAVASHVTLPNKLIYNASASAPIGLYWLDNRPVERDDYVLVQVPEQVRALVEDRGYLPPDIPLIKRIVAENGDTVCRRDREIMIEGITVTVARTEDRWGRKMPVWSGCHVLDEWHVFLLQRHPDSLDSRYFGPVDRRLIIARATRLRLPWHERREN